MGDVLKDYVVGDAIDAAIEELRMTLLGGGDLRIGVHKISRDNFDRVAGDAQHFAKTSSHAEFWTKTGFDWHNDRHVVAVTYFTNEPPVVVPIAPKGFAADTDPPYGDDRGPDEDEAQ